jgi:reactive intermediate/imine deaminase
MGRTFFRHWASCAAGALVLAAPAAAEDAFPFAPATRAGDLLFLSGQIGVAPGSARPVAGGLVAEVRQAMDNIGATLAQHGLGYGDLVKCTAMLTDMAQWGAFNRVYAGYFENGAYPARSAMGVSALALGAEVEIECIARLPARPVAINPGTPLGPYAQAVVANGMIHISGIIAFDGATSRFAPPDIGAQMARIFANLDAILAASGVGRGDVVRTTLYLRNAGDAPAANAAYAAYFTGADKPARTMVPGVDWGRPDIMAEIDATAVAPAGKAVQ